MRLVRPFADQTSDLPSDAAQPPETLLAVSEPDHAGVDSTRHGLSRIPQPPLVIDSVRELPTECHNTNSSSVRLTRSSYFKVLVTASWILSILFMFGLPLLSRIFNDGWGPIYPAWKYQCATPAEDIICGDGQDYLEIAKRLGRIRDGKYVGCTCGQGMFGDWACPVIAKFESDKKRTYRGYSISYFIATAPGTGVMAAFSAFPWLAMWTAGAGDPKFFDHFHGGHLALPENAAEAADRRVYKKVLFWSLFAAQVGYGFFLTNTLCVNPVLHMLSVVIFNGSMVFHYSVVAWHVGQVTTLAAVIRGLLAVAVAGIVIGTVVQFFQWTNFVGLWAFWFFECIGLSLGFGIVPVTVLSFGVGQGRRGDSWGA